jgi:hypothetical protein
MLRREAGVRWGRIAGFLLVGLVLHALASALYVSALQGHKAIRLDRTFLERAPKRISVLICGDSHPRTAIDGATLGDRVVNLSLGGEHFLKTWYRMRKLVEGTNRRVDTLVLSLEASSFSSWAAWNFAPEYVWGRYVDFGEIGRIRGDRWGYAARTLKASFFPYAGELRTLAQMRADRFGFGEDLPTGRMSEDGVEQQRFAALEQARLHFKDQDLMDPGLKWAFGRLVRWTRQYDVQLVVVAYPVTRDYWQWVEASGADARVREEVLKPLLMLHPDVVRLDYHDLYFDRLDLFADPHHLNPDGRAEFTRVLRQDLQDAGVLRE